MFANYITFITSLIYYNSIYLNTFLYQILSMITFKSILTYSENGVNKCVVIVYNLLI